MRIKDGVSVFELHPALRYGLLVVEEESHRKVGHGIVITSMSDGTHRGGSLHYGITFQGRRTLEADDRCRGADIRIRNYTEDAKNRIALRARRRLGPDFDLVLEPDHWHLEYDPKEIA